MRFTGRLSSTAWLTTLLALLCLSSPRIVLAQTITLWHPWAGGRRTVSNLAAEYTRRTGVRVQVRAFNPSSYIPWGRGSQPDIIGLTFPSRQTIARNARLGRLYNMQSEIQQGWYADLWSGPLQTFVIRGSDALSGAPGIYGVPLTVYVRAFVYNKSIFRSASVTPPNSWSDFLLASPKLRREGVVPLAGGMNGIYPSFPVMYERSYLGSFYLLETYFGRYPYTGSRWQREFYTYSEMRRFGLTSYSASQLDKSAAERYFLQGRAAVILDGPWFETYRRALSPQFTNWGVFGPPVDRRAPFLPRLPGGVAEGAVVNARSPNRAAAIRFLRWLTQPAQQVRLANALDSLPVSQQASHSAALRSHLRMFVPYMNYAAIELRDRESPQVLSILYQGARNIIRGTSTPSAALEAAQKAVR